MVIFLYVLVMHFVWGYRTWLYIKYKEDKFPDNNFIYYIIKQTLFRTIGFYSCTPLLIFNNEDIGKKDLVFKINTITIIMYLLMISVLILLFIINK